MLSSLLERCTFPPVGTAVDCAVSGGPDSMALMALAVEAGCNVTAFHVDHQLRAGSAEEAETVRQAALRFDAKFVSLTVAVDGTDNIEARARAARYEALPDGVLTGHTLDDQAETVLLNLMRGAGLDGLAAMRPERRPILGLRRTETHALCRSLRLTVVDDPSNRDPSILRNRVRAELLPVLDDLARRDVAPVLARSASVLRDDADFIDSFVAALDVTDARALSSAAPAVARRAVRNWLRSELDAESHPPDLAAVERVLEVARGIAKATDVHGGLRVVRSAQTLRIERE